MANKYLKRLRHSHLSFFHSHSHHHHHHHLKNMPQVNGSKNHVLCFPLHMITSSEAQFNARDEDEDDEEEASSSGNDSEINEMKEDTEEIAILPSHSSSTAKLRLVPSFKSLLLHLSHNHHHHHHDHHHHASCDGNGMTHHDGLHESRDSMAHHDEEHATSHHDGHDISHHGGEHDICHHDEPHARHGMMTPQDEHRDGHGHGMAHHGDHNDANGSTHHHHHHHHHHHEHLNLGKLVTRSISLPIWHPTFTMGSRHGPTLCTVSNHDHHRDTQHSLHVSRQSHAKIHYSTPPKGHVALYVDDGHQRLVVPISYLNHPDFQVLLRRAQDEFGFRQQGGLVLPCSLSEFQHTLARIQLDHTSHHCHH